METVMSWIWLDGVVEFKRSQSIKAWKKWENSFPPAYLIEMIAQAGAILLGLETDFQQDIVFTKIEAMEFSGQPQEGERLEIEVQVDGLRQEGGWFQGRIFQDGNKILEGKVLLMNVGRLRPDGQGPITFPPQLIAGLAP